MFNGKHAIINNRKDFLEFKNVEVETSLHFKKMKFAVLKWLLLITVKFSIQSTSLMKDFIKQKEFKNAVIFDCFANKKGNLK